LRDNSKIRTAVFYKDYFNEFINSQNPRVQIKILWTIKFVEHVLIVPSKYFKRITNSDSLYEIRIKTGTNIYRTYCFYNKLNELVILNGFQKKTEKTPKQEIIRASLLKYNYEKENEYYNNG
jgi:phage-related protein